MLLLLCIIKWFVIAVIASHLIYYLPGAKKSKMDGNKDESEKCVRIAEKYIRGGDRDKAVKFLQKAERLYPSERAKGLFLIVHLDPEINGRNMMIMIIK